MHAACCLAVRVCNLGGAIRERVDLRSREEIIITGCGVITQRVGAARTSTPAALASDATTHRSAAAAILSSCIGATLIGAASTPPPPPPPPLGKASPRFPAKPVLQSAKAQAIDRKSPGLSIAVDSCTRRRVQFSKSRAGSTAIRAARAKRARRVTHLYSRGEPGNNGSLRLYRRIQHRRPRRRDVRESAPRACFKDSTRRAKGEGRREKGLSRVHGRVSNTS
jgi:hypothetical protein